MKRLLIKAAIAAVLGLMLGPALVAIELESVRQSNCGPQGCEDGWRFGREEPEHSRLAAMYRR